MMPHALVLWWLSAVLAVAAAQWNPATIADHSTIEFLTLGPEEGEHWSTVWFVVIDDAVYLRLGPRAATRIDQNTTAPLLKLRESSGEVHAMRYEKAPDMAEQVAAAMAKKYWTDILGEPFRKLGLTSPTVIVRMAPAS